MCCRGLWALLPALCALTCSAPTLPITIVRASPVVHASTPRIEAARGRRVLVVAAQSPTVTSVDVGTASHGTAAAPRGAAASGFNLAATFAERRMLELGWHPVAQDVLARSARDCDGGVVHLSPGEAALAFGRAAGADLAFVVRSVSTRVDAPTPALPCQGGRRLLPYVVTVDAVALAVESGDVAWSGSVAVPSGSLLRGVPTAHGFPVGATTECASVPESDPVWRDPEVVALYCARGGGGASLFGAPARSAEACDAPIAFRLFVERAMALLVDAFDAAARPGSGPVASAHASDAGAAAARDGAWWER